MIKWYVRFPGVITEISKVILVPLMMLLIESASQIQRCDVLYGTLCNVNFNSLTILAG
ncbi:hypothetical protein [Peribacillus frigoritolerans]|uniref:hypothetical protein n=1 Tax=Peribacillus frigoritolerans TaxID=450367 RepID=UPI0020C0A2FB|nr:hypothetical protein [Peribacillus frigoritolerans]